MIGEIEEKGIMTIIQGDLESMMHYAKSDSKIYSLTKKDTEKVKKVLVENSAKVKFAKGNKDIVKGTITLIDDKEIVIDFFKRMSDLNCNYFKEYTEDLLILEINI